jgi:hypothetical protein
MTKVSTRLGYVPFREHATLIVAVRLSKSDRGFKAALTSADTVTHTSGAREISWHATSTWAESGRWSIWPVMPLLGAAAPLR